MPRFDDWLIPDWPVPAHVHAVFTTRHGGCSSAPYDGLNLGDHVADDPICVQQNRDELSRHLGAKPVFLSQVHGTRVVDLQRDSENGHQADAAVCALPKLACTILVADCLPMVLSDSQGSVVGALHAGWRGLAAGIVSATVEAMRARTDAPLLCWLGPCIGPHAFEVGLDVHQIYGRCGWLSQEGLQACFLPQPGSKFLADLPGLARLALQRAGVQGVYGNDGGVSWCTVSQPSRFFSHRRDAARNGRGIASTGRMAACIWRD